MTDRELTRERLLHALQHAALLAERLMRDDDLPERSRLTLGHVRRESIAIRETTRALEM